MAAAMSVVVSAKLGSAAVLSSWKGNKISSKNLISMRTTARRGLVSLRSPRFRVFCAAKSETVGKVMQIVKQQLALGDDAKVAPESQFTDLGADSLDTVEIVMALEEEFGITVEEDNAQSITTIQDAADLIDKLVADKPPA
uniref:Acyl carrier protein n=1 Tax=Leersia perrieri TaxID=77586 RepID=A0A0D9XSG5_9ORYZ